MRIFAAPRQKGKTRIAVEMAVDLDAYLAVKDRHEARRVSQMHPRLRFPITYDDILQGHMKGSWIKNVVIDNIDDFVVFVCRMSGVTPMLGTIDSDFASNTDLRDIVRKNREEKKRNDFMKSYGLRESRKIVNDCETLIKLKATKWMI